MPEIHEKVDYRRANVKAPRTFPCAAEDKNRLAVAVVLKYGEKFEIKGTGELELVLVFARISIGVSSDFARSKFFTKLKAGK